jgi:hypothetical protein
MNIKTVSTVHIADLKPDDSPRSRHLTKNSAIQLQMTKSQTISLIGLVQSNEARILQSVVVANSVPQYRPSVVEIATENTERHLIQ